MKFPHDLVDEVVLCDDASRDNTYEEAKALGINHVIRHEQNRGYGGNQKTLYKKALEINGDIVIMLHPDYQYTPLLIPSMVNIIRRKSLSCRSWLTHSWKGSAERRNAYSINIGPTGFSRFFKISWSIINCQNIIQATGHLAADVLRSIPFDSNSDDFIFDNEMLSQIIYAGFPIAEVTCPTKYFEEASSINVSRSMKYGLGVLRVSLLHRFQLWGIIKHPLYKKITQRKIVAEPVRL